VFAAVLGLYLQQGLSLLGIHSQAQHQLAIVQRLVKDNGQLARQQKSLSDPTTIERAARVLGMVRPGEHPYVVTGLPNR
jgi:cell division protein FtsB